MIFATVGTQLPFDRLIRALDEWAARNPHEEVFAQIGNTDYIPQHIAWERTMTAEAFDSRLIDCDTVVAHAGMGTIISSVEYGKRVVCMPRRASYGEHRNDHQLATADRLAHLNNLEVVHSAEDLALALSANRTAQDRAAGGSMATMSVSTDLLSEIRQFAGLAIS
jgi:UDP-N-acetylglucosamine transferase subunit ALG13